MVSSRWPALTDEQREAVYPQLAYSTSGQSALMFESALP